MAALLSRGELRGALQGVWLLARFDQRGFACFDASPRGFWRSFWAAAITLPFAAAVVATEMVLTHQAAPVRYALYQLIGYAIGWLLWPLVALHLADWLGKGERYFTYIVAYNWFHLAQLVILVPTTILDLTGAAGSAPVLLLWLASVGLLLGYEWFVTRRGLMVAAGAAMALVLIDFLLTLFIDFFTEILP